MHAARGVSTAGGRAAQSEMGTRLVSQFSSGPRFAAMPKCPEIPGKSACTTRRTSLSHNTSDKTCSAPKSPRDQYGPFKWNCSSTMPARCANTPRAGTPEARLAHLTSCVAEGEESDSSIVRYLVSCAVLASRRRKQSDSDTSTDEQASHHRRLTMRTASPRKHVVLNAQAGSIATGAAYSTGSAHLKD